MEFETLLLDVEDGVATLTLNRPDRHNSINGKMAEELPRAWQTLIRDPEVVCVIFTGAGDKALCTGIDVADVASGALGGGKGERQKLSDSVWGQLTAIHNQCWKPVIAAVNGMVVGGGLHFVTDADLVVCADHATFFDTHVKVGLVAGLEPVGLARRIPLESVLRMALLGGSERLDAAAAKELGLVGEILPSEQLMPRARELASKIGQHSPTALALSKRAIWQSLDRGLDEGLENAWSIIFDHVQHPDLTEGATAFVEKRKPKWAPYTG
jgi:enoyl-CoA hydratase/carnithine racemase